MSCGSKYQLAKKCGHPNHRCQEFPENQKTIKLNVSLEELRKKLEQSGEEGPVYQYILSTVENVNGKFCQTGSAPNFQGGIITLCTCKHWMRTFRSPERWKNCWIAGHTNVKAGDGQQHLFYLMKIQDAYENFLDLWNAEFWKESHYDRKAKNTANNPFGDVYEPKKGVNRNKREALRANICETLFFLSLV